MALDLEDERWPVWVPPADASQRITDGYGQIARFVSVKSLTGLRDLSAGVRTEVEGECSGLPTEVNRIIAARLYRQLSDCRVRYDRAPWHPGWGQPLRDPGWVLAPRETATCIDFALLYAAMCLREGLAPYLVLLRGLRAHAVVAVDLARTDPLRQAGHPEGAEEEPSSGVFRVVALESFINNPLMLLVDPTCCSATDHRDFEGAVDNAIAAVRDEAYENIHLVDVALRQRCGDDQLGPPGSRGALRHPLPTPQRDIRLFPSHAATFATLTDWSGTIVALGPQGVGKSELARRAAASVDSGRGWFLAAANKAALINALAAAELHERGWQLSDLEGADRDGFARAALTRLASTDAPWAVVVDNADRGPAELRGWLPEPDPEARQLVIVTTTNPDWRDSGLEVLDIEALRADEVAGLLKNAALVKLAAGRPLMINAFEALHLFPRLSLEELLDALGAPGDLDDPTTGPRVYWDLLRGALTAPEVEAASVLAWLPPERTPLRVLAAVDRRSGPAVDTLTSAGLVGRLGGPEPAVSLHRLLGRVIRDDVNRRGEDTATVTRLLSVPDARSLLMSDGDVDTTAALATSLDDGKSPAISGCDRRAFGVALWALGAMQEMHDTTKTSADTFGRALRHLDQADPQNHSFIADCLHGQAREVNQHNVKDPQKVADARRNIGRAIALRDPKDAGGIGKHQALEGLLRQRHAVNTMGFGSPEQLAELHAALDILEDSWIRRQEAMGADHPLVDRGLFNRGGIRIDLAQREPANAVEYLTVAEEVYTATLDYRTHTYRDPHPLTAASHYGLAVTWYYRALFDASVDAETLLFDATREAFISLDQRRDTDGGHDGDDAAKSARLLSKIALARCLRAKGHDDLGAFIAEVDRELKP